MNLQAAFPRATAVGRNSPLSEAGLAAEQTPQPHCHTFVMALLNKQAAGSASFTSRFVLRQLSSGTHCCCK